MANQKLPIIDWTSGKIKELPSVEEKKAFENYCKSKGIEELDIDKFYNTLKDFKNKDDTYEVVNDFSIDAIKDNFTPPGAKSQKKEHKDEDKSDLLKAAEKVIETSKPVEVNEYLTLEPRNTEEVDEDEMADFQKSLDDYASKNKKGREDIPVGYRR